MNCYTIRQLVLFAIVTGLGISLPASNLSADKYRRDKNIDILHYVFRLALQDESNAIDGTTSIDVRFRNAGVDQLTLDFVGKGSAQASGGMKVRHVRVGQADLDFEHENNRLRIDLARPSQPGETRRLSITYLGVPQTGLVIRDNMHGDRTFFADNFPNRARHWLPLVDHPHDKATCEFIVTAPNDYQVVANGLLVEESDLAEGRRVTHWRQSVPISTYLMVIGAARFAVQHVESVDGIPIQTWVFPQDKAAGFALFGEARKPLEFFAERIGSYPYEKLANVQSTNRYGATEFASSIFYGERIFGRGNAFGLMVHEIAHQWFGDSITTNDWNHVWLSEGFATYLTHLYFEETVSRERLIEGMKRDRQQVIRNAQRNPDQPLVDYRLPVEQTLTGDAYRKGAWVLHMLRHKIGDETFWSGLRQYYRKYRDKNAVSEDFQKVMEEVSGQDLGTFFRQWLYTPAHPKFTGDWHYEEATTQLIVRLNQVQPHHRFSVPLELGIWYDGAEEPRIEKVQINDKSQTFQFRVPAPPVSVVLDPQTWLLMEAQFAKREK